MFLYYQYSRRNRTRQARGFGPLPASSADEDLEARFMELPNNQMEKIILKYFDTNNVPTSENFPEWGTLQRRYLLGSQFRLYL